MTKLACGCVSKFGGFPSEWVVKDLPVQQGNLCERHYHAYRANPWKKPRYSKRQSPVREKVLSFLAVSVRPVTGQELAEAIGHPHTSVSSHLHKLQREKAITVKIIGGRNFYSGLDVAIPATAYPVQRTTVKRPKATQTWFSCLANN